MTKPTPKSRSRGFTLMETVAAMILLAIAAVAIGRTQGSLFANRTNVTTLQEASRLQSECADIVRGVAVNDGYDQVSTTSTRFGTNKCDTLTAYSGYTIPTVAFTDPYTGAACPSGSTCKLVTITQGSLTPLTLLLVNY
jgi:prepilin-type N-terminal cleavage/methylation domain-containing protein